MQPIALPRQGADHGQALTESAHAAFASASALRALWAEGGAAALAPYVPEKALKLYIQAEYDGKYTDFAVMRHCELALLRAACAEPAPFAAGAGNRWLIKTLWSPLSFSSSPRKRSPGWNIFPVR